MSHESQIHSAQTTILRDLLFMPFAKFSELQKATGLESDHVKFQIVHGSRHKGDLVENFEGGHNEWLSKSEMANKKKKYKSFKLELAVGIGEQSFVEAEQIYEQREF